MNERRVLKLVVTVPAIPGVSKLEWCEYVRDAVGGWSGGFDPSDELFHLTRDMVEVDVSRAYYVDATPNDDDDDADGWNGTNLNNATHWHVKYQCFMWDEDGMSSPRMWSDNVGWCKSHWPRDDNYLPRDKWDLDINLAFDKAASAQD